MGIGGISVWQLVIILIVFLLTLIAAPALHAHRNKATEASVGDESNENKNGAAQQEKSGKGSS